MALVTGASRGIGKAIALGLAGAGADVALAGRDGATLAPVAEEIQADLGRRTLCVPLDVADLDAHERAVASILAHFGRIDILVNNAGTNVRRESVDYTPEDWDAVVDTNLKGAFFLTQKIGRAHDPAAAWEDPEHQLHDGVPWVAPRAGLHGHQGGAPAVDPSPRGGVGGR